MHRLFVALLTAAAVAAGSACSDGTAPPPRSGPDTTQNPVTPAVLSVDGHGEILGRFTAEVWVHGNVGYTSTWGARNGFAANIVYVWDVAGARPQLRDSVLVDSSATTLGDLQVTDDGRYLVVATEFNPGYIVIFDLTDPFKPKRVTRFNSPDITRGVHTAEVRRVSGRNYAFLAGNSGVSHPARLVIVDINDPANPRQVFMRDMGRPFVHDVFVRDGLLFTAEWHDGVTIWDIGGGGRGGTPANPVSLGNVRTVNGSVHNIYWFHDPTNGSKRYAFVGEEGPSNIGNSASGDLHVVDVTDLTRPVEVAAYYVPGAGAHNFTADEPNGILYAAFYNGGVRAIDVRGDLGTCTAAQKFADGRCDLAKMGRVRGIGLLDRGRPVYIWGVHFSGSHVYASDMLNGLWKIRAIGR